MLEHRTKSIFRFLLKISGSRIGHACVCVQELFSCSGVVVFSVLSSPVLFGNFPPLCHFMDELCTTVLTSAVSTEQVE